MPLQGGGGGPGIFFQGDERVNGGDGDLFGDGLRCAGTNVVRLELPIQARISMAGTTVPDAEDPP